MKEGERETPALCRHCRQWLCASKDQFCACCGAGVVAINLSSDQLLFAYGSAASLTISNQGLFRLYWAAEIVSPEARTTTRFSLSPDYGIIAPGEQQLVSIRLLPHNQPVRAYLEIASNDPRRPELKVTLTVAGEGS
jgi:hypothetical protein